MENKRKALGKGLEQLFNSEPLNIDTLNNYEKEIVNNTKESDIAIYATIKISIKSVIPKSTKNFLMASIETSKKFTNTSSNLSIHLYLF